MGSSILEQHSIPNLVVPKFRQNYTLIWLTPVKKKHQTMPLFINLIIKKRYFFVLVLLTEAGSSSNDG